MGFPRSYVSTTMALSPNPADGVAPVLDCLEGALQDYDAEITHRGDTFFEFKVPILARLATDLTLRLGHRSHTPLSFIGSGSFSATPLRDHVVVSAEVRISQYLVTRVGVLAVLSGALNPFGSVSSLLFGASVGLGIGVICYALARWQFGLWLDDLDRLLRQNSQSGPGKGRRSIYAGIRIPSANRPSLSESTGGMDKEKVPNSDK